MVRYESPPSFSRALRMLPLLLLLLAPSGPLPGSGTAVGVQHDVVARGISVAAPLVAPPRADRTRRAVDDGTRRLTPDRWANSGVRRRRAHRQLRTKVRRFGPRTVRTDEADERRHAARDAALRIQRATAVGRRVARSSRMARTPSRAGNSDTRPPAA